MGKNEYVVQLVDLYKKTFDKNLPGKNGFPPEKYFHTRPTIPWIGENYDEGRILIYASAENLNDDWVGKNKGVFESKEIAFKRHDYFWKNDSSDYTPKEKIGIEPFDSGGLRLAGIMCLQKLGFEIPPDEDILNYVAVANLSKFSLKRDKKKRNKDVGKKDLAISYEYIENDIKVLKPKIIINASGKRRLSILQEDSSHHCINLPQYTHRQLGFHHLRGKISDAQIKHFRPILTNLIEKYGERVGKAKEKVSNGKIRSDDFVRYFCLLQKKLDKKLS